MPNNKYPRGTEDDVEGHKWTQKATEDDVEGHGATKYPRATEDDVEGHGATQVSAGHRGRRRGPRLRRQASKATEDDVEGHKWTQEGHRGRRRGPQRDRGDLEGHRRTTSRATEASASARRPPRTTSRATARRSRPRGAREDDVEGHNIGVMNPMLARDLARAREQDIQREASRNSLIGEAKRALGRKR